MLESIVKFEELNNFFVPPYDLGYKLIFKFIIDDTDIISVESLIKNIKKLEDL